MLELNQRHKDFQSSALPTELMRHILNKFKLTLVPPTGIEPVPKDFQSSVLTKLHYRGKILIATSLELNQPNYDYII